jgi:hypothetical protein
MSSSRSECQLAADYPRRNPPIRATRYGSHSFSTVSLLTVNSLFVLPGDRIQINSRRIELWFITSRIRPLGTPYILLKKLLRVRPLHNGIVEYKRGLIVSRH